MNEKNQDFKQARARKINDNNFYLTIRYLLSQTLDNKRLAYHELKSKIHALHDIAPHENTSKAYIEQSIDKLKAKISRNEESIFVDQYPLWSSKKQCEKEILRFNAEIEKLRDSYIELTQHLMFDLHTIVVQLDDGTYSAMTNWVKQARSRAKKHKRQVTLSYAALDALKELKSTLNVDTYDEAITMINHYAKVKKWK